MREWCGCGAAIHARRRDVLTWRGSHRHERSAEPPMVPPTGAASATETAWQPIGFLPASA